LKRKIRNIILFTLVFSLISGQVLYSFAESGVTLVDDSGYEEVDKVDLEFDDGFEEPEYTVKELSHGGSSSFMEINSDLVLQENTLIGEGVVLKGNLDLNGFKLMIEGDLLQTGGSLRINGGELYVKGDYRIESTSGGSVSANLYMTNDNDYVKVDGNFVVNSSNNNTYLTAGTMEIKGDFIQKGSAINNFRASENHKVILSGERPQRVRFGTLGNSKFNQLEIRNTSEEGVVFESRFATSGLVTNGRKIKAVGIEGVDLKLVGDVTIEGDDLYPVCWTRS